MSWRCFGRKCIRRGAFKRPREFEQTEGGKQLPHSKTAGAVGHTRFGTFNLQQTVPSHFPAGSGWLNLNPTYSLTAYSLNNLNSNKSAFMSVS
jgi:hypothetical protein